MVRFVLIVSVVLNLMVAPDRLGSNVMIAPLAALVMAERSVPGPLSALLVTTCAEAVAPPAKTSMSRARIEAAGRTKEAHLNFLEVMAEDVAPDGAFTPFRWFSTNISPLAGLAGTLPGGFTPAFQRRRRDIFVVKCHIKHSPARGGIFHVQRCARNQANKLPDRVRGAGFREGFCLFIMVYFQLKFIFIS